VVYVQLVGEQSAGDSGLIDASSYYRIDVVGNNSSELLGEITALEEFAAGISLEACNTSVGELTPSVTQEVQLTGVESKVLEYTLGYARIVGETIEVSAGSIFVSQDMSVKLTGVDIECIADYVNGDKYDFIADYPEGSYAFGRYYSDAYYYTPNPVIKDLYFDIDSGYSKSFVNPNISDYAGGSLINTINKYYNASPVGSLTIHADPNSIDTFVAQVDKSFIENLYKTTFVYEIRVVTGQNKFLIQSGQILIDR